MRHHVWIWNFIFSTYRTSECKHKPLVNNSGGKHAPRLSHGGNLLPRHSSPVCCYFVSLSFDELLYVELEYSVHRRGILHILLATDDKQMRFAPDRQRDHLMEVPRCRESWEFDLFLRVVDPHSTVLMLPEGYAFDLIRNSQMLVAPGNDHR